MGERREHPRLEVALEARYQAEGSVLERRAMLTALSAAGAALVAEEPLEPGTRLDSLRFTLGEQLAARSFRLTARIVSCEHREGIGRSDEYQIAVGFIDPAPADAERINDFVLERLASDPAYNPRIELDQPVAVRFQRFDQFLQEVSKNLSRTGMFIRAGTPRPVGSRFDFVLQVGDDFNLVQGRAEVVWTRSVAEGADRPPGMGVRFLSLDRTSEGVLRRLIERRIEPSYPRALEPRPGPTSPPGPPPGPRREPPDDEPGKPPTE